MKYLLSMFITMAIAVGITGCIEDRPGEVNKMAFEVISKGTASGITNQQIVVIRDSTELTSFWNSHSAGIVPVPDIPIVDFSKDILVAAVLGNSSNKPCKNTVEFYQVASNGNNHIIVDINVREPSTTPSCVAAEQPFEIIKMSSTSHFIDIRVRVDEYDL